MKASYISLAIVLGLVMTACSKTPEANKGNCKNIGEILPTLTESEANTFVNECRSLNSAEHMSETTYKPAPKSKY